MPREGAQKGLLALLQSRLMPDGAALYAHAMGKTWSYSLPIYAGRRPITAA
jgi:hypothetical protein